VAVVVPLGATSARKLFAAGQWVNQVGCVFGGRPAGQSELPHLPDYCLVNTNVKFFNSGFLKFHQIAARSSGNLAAWAKWPHLPGGEPVNRAFCRSMPLG
jgi:hypothetical protein